MPRIVVAVPAKDEADRIGACLSALSAQTVAPDAVQLLLNNCADGTETVVSLLAPSLAFDLHMDSLVLPPAVANAGIARRIAMDRAAATAGPDGILLTTDADAVVPPDWIERSLRAINAGIDAVCGRIDIDPVEGARIPDHLVADDALETEYATLLDEIAWELDPDPDDPWPRHTEASGASIAVTVQAFRRAGGIPPVASGEDRALIAALARIDARIRHDPAITVMVSARTEGRAPGGMADTIRRRMIRQDEFADDRLEFAADAFRRADYRRRTRAASAAAAALPTLAVDLGIPTHELAFLLGERHFGATWAAVEARTPLLVRRRVRFSDLPRQIAYAKELLHWQRNDRLSNQSAAAP